MGRIAGRWVSWVWVGAQWAVVWAAAVFLQPRVGRSQRGRGPLQGPPGLSAEAPLRLAPPSAPSLLQTLARRVPAPRPAAPQSLRSKVCLHGNQTDGARGRRRELPGTPAGWDPGARAGLAPKKPKCNQPGSQLRGELPQGIYLLLKEIFIVWSVLNVNLNT